MEEIKDFIIQYLYKNYHTGEDYEIIPESNLKDDLNIDSLERVELSIELEVKFDIHISDEEVSRWVTVQDIIDGVTYLVKLK